MYTWFMSMKKQINKIVKIKILIHVIHIEFYKPHLYVYFAQTLIAHYGIFCILNDSLKIFLTLVTYCKARPSLDWWISLFLPRHATFEVLISITPFIIYKVFVSNIVIGSWNHPRTKKINIKNIIKGYQPFFWQG